MDDHTIEFLHHPGVVHTDISQITKLKTSKVILTPNPSRFKNVLEC